ncbi:prolyl oligopeptidase family serine peptidase [Steroidobacter sp.]|uniref:S9 family peptidase n=1 Tax=Steroidobacter sp. TaxID=1978227 RepID=UPI001A48F95C|nr:prolyl oligopeptidase family serine peptidase [Steroidobacter sp.]MBL8265034.1 prolyl oligopeptidase family serine peptidase [Steroidobacter sp.]
MTVNRRARGLMLALVFSLAPVAQVWSYTLEQVRSYAFPEDLVAAKQGAQVAWQVNDHGKRNIWVAKGPDFAARQVTNYTQDDGQEISSLLLTEDGSRLVYVRGGEHGGNWDRGLPVNVLSHPAGTKVEIWTIPVAGGTPVRLAEGDYPTLSPDGRKVVFIKDGAAWIVPSDGSAEPKKLFTARGGTGSLQWSPDGSRLAFISSRDATSYVGIYSDDNTPIRWIAPDVYRDSQPTWSPDGKQIAFIRRLGDGGTPPLALEFEPRPYSIWIGDAQTGTAKAIWSSGKTLRESTLSGFFEWAAGDRLVFNSYKDGWQHVYSLSTKGGTPELLTPGNYMVEEATLSADRKRVIFAANTGTDKDDHERRHLFQTPVERSKVTQLTSGAGLEWSPVVTGDDRLLYLSGTATRPPLPAILKDGKQKLIAPELLPAKFPADDLVTPKSVTFQAADGLTVHGQLFVPKTKAKGKRPAVVYLHGGPQRQMVLGWHMMGYYSNDYAINQYLAHRGFVVLAVNYRLGPGYGFDFHFPPKAGQRGASEYQDVQAAGKYLQSLPDVDGQRVGIYGGSYGGYLTAMGLAHDSALFKAGVDIHGVHDWILQYGLKELFKREQYEVPADTKQAIEAGWTSSPVSALAGWKSPVLFITGDDDRNVRVGQTVDLSRRLRDTGVHQEALILVDETHSLQRHENVLKANQATVEFLERFLKEANRE